MLMLVLVIMRMLLLLGGRRRAGVLLSPAQLLHLRKLLLGTADKGKQDAHTDGCKRLGCLSMSSSAACCTCCPTQPPATQHLQSRPQSGPNPHLSAALTLTMPSLRAMRAADRSLSPVSMVTVRRLAKEEDPVQEPCTKFGQKGRRHERHCCAT